MRKLITFLSIIFILSFPLISQGDESVVQSKPAVYAVMMHADWCGTCKALAPKISQAREIDDLDGKNVLFVKLDLTDDSSKHQAAMMANVLGFMDVYDNNAGKTGFMLLIDAVNGKKIAQITNKMDIGTIAEKISDASQSSNS